MKQDDLSRATNPDIRSSMVALRRAAKLARQIAVQTDTAIIVVKDGRPARITADELRKDRGTDEPD